ncbi:hypothetical protein CP061683_1326, partial [Chlamydia psittaci 06-1683]
MTASCRSRACVKGRLLLDKAWAISFRHSPI